MSQDQDRLLNGEDFSLGSGKVTDLNKDFKKLVFLPPKDEWQNYSIWRVSMIKSNLFVYYTGSEDGSIWSGRNTLVNVLRAIEDDASTSQDFGLYQFQKLDQNFLTKSLSTRRGTQNENTIPLRYARVNFKTRKAALFQNLFSIKPNTIELESVIQTIVISCTIEELLSPLVHISTPSINVKSRDTITFENDV